MKFINPFPPVGTSRVWREEYIHYLADDLEDLSWKFYGKFIKKNLSQCPDRPGVYAFIREHSANRLTPQQGKVSSIVYVGQGRNLRVRINEYLSDLKSVQATRTTKRKVRDSVRVMFEEYDDKLSLFYCVLPPEKIIHYEDYLIKIFDPIFNRNQRLNEDDYKSSEYSIPASLGDAEEGFSESTVLENEENETPPNALTSRLGISQPAF